MEEEADDNSSRKENSTSSCGQMDFPQENTDKDIVLRKFLCKSDVGDSFSGKSQMLKFEDYWKNKFRMEFVHSNFGDYYFRTGWERYRDQHKLKYMDLLTVYKKRKHNNAFDDYQYLYVIEHLIVTPDYFQDQRTLIMLQLIPIVRDLKYVMFH